MSFRIRPIYPHRVWVASGTLESSMAEAENANAGGAYLERNEEQSLIRGEALISNLADIEKIVVGVSATFPLPRIIGRVDGLKLNVEGQCRHLDCMYRERKAIGWIVTHRWTPSRYPGFQVWTVGELKVESVLKCDRNGDIVWSGRPNQMMYSFTV